MPLKGYTTTAQPNRIFQVDELLDWLASPENNSGFTHSMGWLMTQGHRGDNAFSVTSLTGTCPREYRLKQSEDYLLSLEKGMFALDGTFYHAMVEMTPKPEGYDVFRERRFGKIIQLRSGETITLAGRMDEVILNWKDGKALIRDYKRTKSVPYNDKPWPTHLKQLEIYRYLLSDYPEPPIVVASGGEFWEKSVKWVESAPINVGYGEVAYRSMEDVKRVTVDESDFRSSEEIHNWLLDVIPYYIDQNIPMVKFLDAIDPKQWNYGWKCLNYCPVHDACKKHYNNYEIERKPFDPNDY
jgi:hypothetical protein